MLPFILRNTIIFVFLFLNFYQWTRNKREKREIKNKESSFKIVLTSMVYKERKYFENKSRRIKMLFKIFHHPIRILFDRKRAIVQMAFECITRQFSSWFIEASPCDACLRTPPYDTRDHLLRKLVHDIRNCIKARAFLRCVYVWGLETP